MLRLPLLISAICLPFAGVAQQVNMTCTMAVLCVETSPCSDWGQDIQVTHTVAGWRIVWEEDLPSDYEVLADIPAPEGSLEPTRMLSLFHANEDTQAVQMLSFDEAGNIVVTLHQPHLRPRSVTGYGNCETGGAE